MSSRLLPLLCASLALATTGCASTGKDVDTPDLGQCEADEGLIVVRFLTQHAKEEDLRDLERDPDIDYTVKVGSSKNPLANQWNVMSQMGGFQIEAEEGPALF